MSKKPKDPPTDGPLPEDHESQPHKGRKKRSGQAELPGVLDQTVDHPDITRLAKQIKALRSERGEISAKLKRLNATMVEKMKAAGLTTYVTKVLIVEVETGEHVKIKDIGDEEADAA